LKADSAGSYNRYSFDGLTMARIVIRSIDQEAELRTCRVLRSIKPGPKKKVARH